MCPYIPVSASPACGCGYSKYAAVSRHWNPFPKRRAVPACFLLWLFIHTIQQTQNYTMQSSLAKMGATATPDL